MVQTCFIRGCQSKGVKGNACSFFRFPSNETEAQYWLEKIFQLNEQTTEPSKYARVCEKHFAEQDIKRNGSRNVLKKGAIPTVCLNYVYDERTDVEYLEKEESMECGDDNNGPMDYLLTYKLSQDHIETFFGCIRSRGGFNNNPNASQFCSAYKQLMIHNEIKCPSQSNCLSENISILTIFSAQSKILHSPREDGDVESCISATLSEDYKGMIVSHGQFVGLCNLVLEVVVLCRIAEKNLQTVETENRLSEAQMYLRLLNKCIRDVPTKLLDNMDEHIKECGPLENHRYLLIKAIIEEYLRVKLFHIGKLRSTELHRKFVRASNTKVTLFAGQ